MKLGVGKEQRAVEVRRARHLTTFLSRAPICRVAFHPRSLGQGQGQGQGRGQHDRMTAQSAGLRGKWRPYIATN